MAPSGWQGRLALLTDQASLDVAISLASTPVQYPFWISLKATVNPHSIGSFNMSEFGWFSGTKMVCPLDYLPSAGTFDMTSPTYDCIYTASVGWKWKEMTCSPAANIAYICEYFLGKLKLKV